jgi:predicted dehydrogenase
MANKLRFGVLSTANIGLKKVLPAMMKGELTEVTAIASRDLGKAQQAAKSLGIPKAYGSYEELLADPEVDAIYNPLPNQLHVPLTIQAAEAGKHVLCEKPIGLSVAEAKQLVAVRDRTGVQIAEAFMIRCHPQWLHVRQLIADGHIGVLRAVSGVFSYFNANPANIRNHVEYGGGGIYDIGCYLIQASRFGFGAEPRRVVSLLDRDPEMKVDRLASVILDFDGGQSTWICSTQMIPHQRVTFLGTKGRIEILIPFNAPPDSETSILVDSTGELNGKGIERVVFPAVDQYTLQGDSFARAVRGESQVPVPLEDAIGNMAVIEAIFRSAESAGWEIPQK